AQRNDAAQKQALIGERIENNSQRTSLVVMACNVAVQTITDGSDYENGNCSITHPFKRRAVIDALAIINGHRHQSRNHQNPNDGDLVCSGHDGPQRSNRHSNLQGNLATLFKSEILTRHSEESIVFLWSSNQFVNSIALCRLCRMRFMLRAANATKCRIQVSSPFLREAHL